MILCEICQCPIHWPVNYPIIMTTQMVHDGCLLRQKLSQISEIIVTWDSYQGHQACWYYPELFKQIAAVLNINLINNHNPLPRECEFKEQCGRYRRTLYFERINDDSDWFSHGNAD